MDERTIPSFARKRAPIISLGGLLVMLAVLSLALLVAAQGPPVSVEKTAAPDTVTPGEMVQYTVVFSNSTAAAVDIERITDTLPTDFTYVSLAGGSQIVDDPNGTTGTIVWDSGPYAVPANDTLTLSYNVMVGAPASATPYENQVQALLDTSEVIEDSAPVHVGGVDLSGSKSASAAQVNKGQAVDYTVTFSNAGTVAATLTVISDTLPADFHFRQMIDGPLPAPTVQDNKLIWTGPHNVPAQGQIRFTYRVVVDGEVGQTYANSVKAAYSGGVVGPYDTDVTVLEAMAFLPLVIKTSAPTEVYRLTYDSKPGDNFEIMAVNADGSDLVNVSNATGGDLDPTWSPAGDKIAWVSFSAGTGEIMVASPDGSGKVNVSNHAKDDRTPAWSPDGSRVAFSSYREDRWEVYLVDPDGANLTKCTGPDGAQHQCQSHDPIYSPDGAKIAYICGLDQYAEIYIRNADCSGWTRMTDNEVPDEALDWSPDSTKIAYVRYTSRQRTDSDIYVLDVITGQSTKITSTSYADYSPDWSPDGLKIAFSTYLDGSYEIATMNPDGTAITNLTQTAKGDYVPHWSSDGLKIAFLSKRDDNSELYVMDANGSNQTRLTNTSADESEHDWKPQ